jgi:hypothetical protein
MANPFVVGDRIHGFASGYFGRDSYACRTVEAVGPDWVLTRNDRDEVEVTQDRSGRELEWLYEHRADGQWCVLPPCDRGDPELGIDEAPAWAAPQQRELRTGRDD